MIYGLYLSAQGAQAQTVRLNVLSNNIANTSTGGFKRDLAIFQSYPTFDVENGTAEELPGNLNESTGGLSLAEITTDFFDGPMTQTGGTFDVALNGPGFLWVSDGQDTFLTRNGRFSLNDQNQLVAQDTGFAVLGLGDAPIQISTALGIDGVVPGGMVPTVSLVGRDVNPLEAGGVLNLLLSVQVALANADDRELARLNPLIIDEVARFNLVRGSIGSRLRSFDEIENRLKDEEILLRESLSAEFDTNITEVLTQLAFKQSSLQATLQVAATTLQLNLFNFL